MVAGTIESVTLIVLAMMFALTTLWIALEVRSRRREEYLIRRWCNTKGYAVNHIHPFNSSLLSFWLLFLAGWLCWWIAYKRAWQLRVYDDEGGQKDIVVRVDRSGQVEETWN